MRAKEFIRESKTEKLSPEQTAALPAAYIIPELQNQNPYLQYRFGVAMAGAKGAAQRKKDGVPTMAKTGPFGESEVVVSYGYDVGPFIDDALNQMGLSGKKMIGSTTSTEITDAGKVSPMKPFKGYNKK